MRLLCLTAAVGIVVCAVGAQRDCYAFAIGAAAKVQEATDTSRNAAPVTDCDQPVKDADQSADAPSKSKSDDKGDSKPSHNSIYAAVPLVKSDESSGRALLLAIDPGDIQIGLLPVHVESLPVDDFIPVARHSPRCFDAHAPPTA